jgi:hypothetical protein
MTLFCVRNIGSTGASTVSGHEDINENIPKSGYICEPLNVTRLTEPPDLKRVAQVHGVLLRWKHTTTTSVHPQGLQEIRRCLTAISGCWCVDAPAAMEGRANVISLTCECGANAGAPYHDMRAVSMI